MRRALLAAFLCLLLCACAPTEDTPVETLDPPPQDAVEPAKEEESGGLTVHTDWSKLEEQKPLLEPIGSRWYEEYTGELIPQDDYGPLIPYAGLRLMDDWPAEQGCLYGLMTENGVVVTDPVYSSVHAPAGYGEDGKPYVLPLLVMRQGNGEDGATYVIAASDGSWSKTFDGASMSASVHGLLLFQEDRVSVMTSEGEIQRTWSLTEHGISQETIDSMRSDLFWGDGIGGSRRQNYLALEWDPESDYEKIRAFDLTTGDIRVFDYMEEWEAMVTPPEQTHWDVETAVPDAQLLTDRLLGYEAPHLLALMEYPESGMVTTYYRQDGTPLPELTLYGGRWYQRVNVVGGLIEVLDLNLASYYDLETMECVFRTYLNYEGD